MLLVKYFISILVLVLIISFYYLISVCMLVFHLLEKVILILYLVVCLPGCVILKVE